MPLDIGTVVFLNHDFQRVRHLGGNVGFRATGNKQLDSHSRTVFEHSKRLEETILLSVVAFIDAIHNQVDGLSNQLSQALERLLETGSICTFFNVILGRATELLGVLRYNSVCALKQFQRCLAVKVQIEQYVLENTVGPGSGFITSMAKEVEDKGVVAFVGLLLEVIHNGRRQN